MRKEILKWMDHKGLSLNDIVYAGGALFLLLSFIGIMIYSIIVSSLM